MAVEEGWQKATQKWPEPWLSWEGAIEEGKGQLILEEDEPITIRYTLSILPAISASGLRSWRGAAWPVDRSPNFCWMESEARIVLNDGRHGSVVITNNSIQRILFVGTGPILAVTESASGGRSIDDHRDSDLK